ncbi:MAG TPA: hypothetical protein VK914_13110 [bacterium]|jgi:hypothetical protein|nr:hypothetical protein [bacterium]
MDRRKLKKFGALLALTSLLVLNLHVLAHVFGHDHDDDDRPGKGKASPPCALCQAVLTQTSLAAAPSVQAPSNPLTFMIFPADAAPVREPIFGVLCSTRGPPRALPLSV